MTEKQKEAIKILNRIGFTETREKGLPFAITEEEYFTLLEFIIGSKNEIQYIPYTPNPLDHLPFYGNELKTTCENESTNHLDNNNY